MADVNWNLAVTPDPFKQIAEGRDYSRSIFDQAALLKAGSQYAAGDPASAANTVASRGDFKTAGDLSTLATRRQAGQLYAGGDAAGAGKALAGAGDFETAGKLQEQQIKTIEAQQDAMGRTGSFLTAALADPNLAQNPNLAQQAWGIARQQLAAAQIPPERIAEFEKMFTADPKKAAAIMSHIATEVKVTSDGQGTLYLTDKYGNVVNKLGEDSLFGNTAEGRALNILNKEEHISGPDLARSFLGRQQTQIVQTPSGPQLIQGPRISLPAAPGGTANQPPPALPQGEPAPVPAPGAGVEGVPAPGRTTQVGDRTVTRLPVNRPLTERAITNLTTAGEKITTLDRLTEGFRDPYGGHAILGDWSNTIDRYLGDTTGQSQWWQDYQNIKNEIRNKVFGAALTPGEQVEFDKAQITPGMAPSEIRKNLARQDALVQRATLRLVKAYQANGASKEAIEGALGISLDELGTTPREVPGYAEPTPAATPRVQPKSDAYKPLPPGWSVTVKPGTH